jgi:hypothetical protein
MRFQGLLKLIAKRPGFKRLGLMEKVSRLMEEATRRCRSG